MSTNIDHINLDELLPQKYPFRMIDRVIEFKPGESLTAIKNITGAEWVANKSEIAGNHFPETLLIEAAAQTALLLYILIKEHVSKKKPKYFIGKMDFDTSDTFNEGDQIKICAFASKLLDTGGYSDIKIYKEDVCVGQVTIVYSVKIK